MARSWEEGLPSTAASAWHRCGTGAAGKDGGRHGSEGAPRSFVPVTAEGPFLVAFRRLSCGRRATLHGGVLRDLAAAFRLARRGLPPPLVFNPGFGRGTPRNAAAALPLQVGLADPKAASIMPSNPSNPPVEPQGRAACRIDRRARAVAWGSFEVRADPCCSRHVRSDRNPSRARTRRGGP